MEQETTSIGITLDSLLNKQVQQNREKLIPIVAAIIICERQNILLRGHRDDAKHVNLLGNNPGNFQEILKYVGTVDKNSVFEDHLQNAPKSATYRSKTIQNDIIRYARI